MKQQLKLSPYNFQKGFQNSLHNTLPNTLQNSRLHPDLDHPLADWLPKNVLPMMVPLTEKLETLNYTIHYYKGFEPSLAQTICDEVIGDLQLINPIDIYLYIIDYPHEYTRLDREGCNNGFTQKVGDCYSIVVFRKLFWPKVLIHELFHVLWFVNHLPITRDFPRWDEAIIEAEAVRLAIRKGYINESEYRYFLSQTKNAISNICGGDIMESLRAKQQTAVYEYIYLSDALNNLKDKKSS